MKLILILYIMTHTLPQLPYKTDALEPVMSKETIDYHYGKHLATYITNLNNLIPSTPFENLPLEEIVLKSDGAIYNNAAQAWNHTFFFETFSPKPQQMPSGSLLEAINRDFGSYDNFKEQFSKAALSLFGSGWVWLSKDKDHKLVISALPNAGNPMLQGAKPLMTIDVWEHSYYIDYRNRRADYIKGFWDIVDWSVIEKRLK